MRKSFWLVAAGLILLAGCSAQAPADRDEGQQSQASMAGAPDIPITAAPGVAFNYRYAFRLPDAKIAGVQEDHAQACEKLGIDRCRIVGMRYRVVGTDNVEATLALKLDPAIARNFGKAGIAAVTAANGMLVDAEISGEDAGAAITAVDKQDGSLRTELAKVEVSLASHDLKSDERAALTTQAAELRERLRGNGSVRDANREALARTPMVFQYGSGALIPGFDARSPLRTAIGQAGENLVGSFGVLLVLVLTVLPWVLLAGLGYAGYRWVRRKWPRADIEE
jgi:hypothetical protein